MTKPLDPEIKALRAMDRALRTLDDEERRRSLTYLMAREFGVVQCDVRIERCPAHSARGAVER